MRTGDSPAWKKQNVCHTGPGRPLCHSERMGEWRVLPGRPSSSSSCLGASSRSVPQGQQGRPLTSGTHILEMARWPQITWEMVQPQADWGLTNAKAQAEASDALQEPRFQRQLEPQITIELCHELATWPQENYLIPWTSLTFHIKMRRSNVYQGYVSQLLTLRFQRFLLSGLKFTNM